MTDSNKITVQVELEWRGSWLRAGSYRLGEIMNPMPISDNIARALGASCARGEDWIGLCGDRATGYYPTQSAARAAVEAEVIKQLKGEKS